MSALDSAVKSGKALYAGISNYNAEQTMVAVDLLKQLGTPCLIHQPKYSMLQRWVEKPGIGNNSLLDVLEEKGVGCIPFSPLAQGLLTDKYLKGIPQNSRASKPDSSLKNSDITEQRIQQLRSLNEIAIKRNQSLAQMAIAWLLKDKRVTSVLVGASSVQQLDDNIDSLKNLEFRSEELDEVEKILSFNI
jgi:L-glyceraldehyde 3-phosphate reductase